MNELLPLPYHREIADWLETDEPEVWAWFRSEKRRREENEAIRLDLLKRTYELDPSGHPELYASAAQASSAIGLDLPVTLYQATGGGAEYNAALFFLPGEAHVVFFGRMLELCEGAEAVAILGHELAHYLLWTLEGGRYLTASRILDAMASHPGAENAHFETARLFRLFTEVFADRASLRAVGSIDAVVTALVKTETGLSKVSAASYLNQARKIYARDKTGAGVEGLSHPELHRRVLALDLLSQALNESKAVVADHVEPSENAPAVAADPIESDTADLPPALAEVDRQIFDLIAGKPTLDTLDLHRQKEWMGWTRDLIAELLQPTWMREDRALALARQYFADFPEAPEPVQASTLDDADAGFRHYASYVLLDFAVIDPDSREQLLKHTLQIAHRLGIYDDYEKIVRKELKMLKRDLNKLYQPTE